MVKNPSSGSGLGGRDVGRVAISLYMRMSYHAELFQALTELCVVPPVMLEDF